MIRQIIKCFIYSEPNADIPYQKYHNRCQHNDIHKISIYDVPPSQCDVTNNDLNIKYSLHTHYVLKEYFKAT